MIARADTERGAGAERTQTRDGRAHEHGAERRAQGAQGVPQARSGAGAQAGRSPALDIIRDSSKTQVLDARRTSKRTSDRTYTAEERAAWTIRRRAANAALSRISRAWLKDADIAQRFPGLMACGAKAQGADSMPVIAKLEADGAVIERGVIRCGSVWACPECSGAKLWRASKRISALLMELAERNRRVHESAESYIQIDRSYSCLLLTLTVPHRPGDSLAEQMRGFSAAFSHLMNSGDVRKMRARRGYVTSIRCFDFTCRPVVLSDGRTVTDWHTHLHVLLIFKGTPIVGEYSDGVTHAAGCVREWADAFEDVRATIWNQWADKTAPRYFKGCKCSPRAYGLESVELSSSPTVADYVAKVVALYVSGTNKSKSGGSVYAPFDLLDDTADGLRDWRRSAWCEFVTASKGFRRVNFATGWRQRLDYVDAWQERRASDVPADRMACAVGLSPRMLEVMADRPEVRRVCSELVNQTQAGAVAQVLTRYGVGSGAFIWGGEDVARAVESALPPGWGVSDHGGRCVRLVSPAERLRDIGRMHDAGRLRRESVTGGDVDLAGVVERRGAYKWACEALDGAIEQARAMGVGRVGGGSRE